MGSSNSNKRKETTDNIEKKAKVNDTCIIKQLTNESNSLTLSDKPLSDAESRVPYHILPPYIPPPPPPHAPPTAKEKGKNVIFTEVRGSELTAEQLSVRQKLTNEGSFVIEAIRRKRISKEGHPQYLIKWHGYGEIGNTWEYAKDLPASSRDFIVAYELSSAEIKRFSKGKQKLTLEKNERQEDVAAFVNSKNENPEPSLVNSKWTESNIRKLVLALPAALPAAPVSPGQNSDVFREKIPDSRENATITKLSVAFKATMSDGTVRTVEHKYLKENFPDLLSKFYEDHLRSNGELIVAPKHS